LIVASAVLVVVALVTFIVGLLGTGVQMIYVSIAASILAFAALVLGVVRGSRKEPAIAGIPIGSDEMPIEPRMVERERDLDETAALESLQEALADRTEPSKTATAKIKAAPFPARAPAAGLRLDLDEQDDDDDVDAGEDRFDVVLPTLPKGRTSASSSSMRSGAGSVAKKPSARGTGAKSSASKSAAKKTAAKSSSAKSSASKTAAKKTTSKSAAKSSASKTAAKKTAKKPAARAKKTSR
jgi:hypothetical protein